MMKAMNINISSRAFNRNATKQDIEILCEEFNKKIKSFSFSINNSSLEKMMVIPFQFGLRVIGNKSDIKSYRIIANDIISGGNKNEK